MMQFRKTYTRDFSIIMEEAWAYALTEGFENRYGARNPNQPPTVHYYNDGAVEEWENPEAVQWISDRLLDKCQGDFMPELIEQYGEFCKQLQEIWGKGYVETREELIHFCNQVFEGMVYFISYYFPAIDDRTPEAARELASRIRERDPFFYASDSAIRSSIKRIFPSTSGYETVILKEELIEIPSLDFLRQRYQHWVVVPGRLSEITTLPAFAKLHPEFSFTFEPVIHTEVVRGQVGYRGQVRGLVRILRRQDQIAKVQEGDILVSPMTTPDFLPAMERAAAFVTDEGGLLCHAAIVAREMGKPCIIGTRIATEVLRDGELVEVDAKTGIARKV